jgi:transposase
VRQVLDGGRSVPQVARSQEMSEKTLANWVRKARQGQPLLNRPPAHPVDEVQAELRRLRQENARLKLEKEPLLNSVWVSSPGQRVKGGRRPGAARPLTRHGREHAGTRPSPAV